MNKSHLSAQSEYKQALLLKKSLEVILNTEELSQQRQLIKGIAAELGTDFLDFAAALLFLQKNPDVVTLRQESIQPKLPTIKMIRYRLDIGNQHQLTPELLTKVLVEESGVDKNNITNVSIRGLYTLIDLPDLMPPDIFQHLKSVEINQRKLDIKRVKLRKKRKHSSHRANKVVNNTPKPDISISAPMVNDH